MCNTVTTHFFLGFFVFDLILLIDLLCNIYEYVFIYSNQPTKGLHNF
jgi:hypothetical protein